MRTLAITLVTLALHPVTALCQSQGTNRPLARADVTASIGAFGARHDVSEERFGGIDWSSSLFKGLGAGYYWTDHLKTEIEAAWPGPSDAYGYFNTRLADGTQVYGYDEHSYRTFKVSAGQSYQFGRNAFFHPFVGGGLDITREHDTIEHKTETTRGPLSTEVSDTAVVRARPFVATGFKAYFSERGFFRGEWKLDFGSRAEGMTWKAGFGVDF
jgi:hypothetical protein